MKRHNRLFANKKANKIGAKFLIIFESETNLRESISNFTMKIERIQKLWKNYIQLNKTRRIILKNKMERILQKLTSKRTQKGKRQSSSKLKNLTPIICDDIVLKYYNKKKLEYCKILINYINEKRNQVKLCINTRLLKKKAPFQQNQPFMMLPRLYIFQMIMT